MAAHGYKGWLAGLLLAAGLVGCSTLPPLERQMLADASRDYTRGDTAGAVKSLDRIIRDYGQAAEISEAYYIRALCRARGGQEQAATQDFQAAIAGSKRRDLTAQCRASLGTFAFRRGDYDQAARFYGEAVGDLPDVPPTDVILYTAGVAMQRAGEWQNAGFQFARVINRFRSRPIAADARRMAAWRHPYFAIQLGAFKDTDRAAKAVQDFRKQRLDASQEYVQRTTDSLWVVITGKYPTYRDAQGALAQLRKRVSGATIIP